MAIVGNYLPIQDGQITRGTTDDIDWDTDFNLGSRARLDRQAILHFAYLTEDNASGLELSFEINGNPIRTVGAFTGFHHGTYHEVFDGSVLDHGANNIRVWVSGGSGDARFSDLVLQYKVDV